MNRNIQSKRVCDPDYLSGGLLYFFNRYYYRLFGWFQTKYFTSINAQALFYAVYPTHRAVCHINL